MTLALAILVLSCVAALVVAAWVLVPVALQIVGAIVLLIAAVMVADNLWIWAEARMPRVRAVLMGWLGKIVRAGM